MSAMYAVYHGPEGLRRIAARVHMLTVVLAEGLRRDGHDLVGEGWYFDTVTIKPRVPLENIRRSAESERMNLRYNRDGTVGVSLDEKTTPDDVDDILRVFGTSATVEGIVGSGLVEGRDLDHSPFRRTTPYLQHPVFNAHHSETRIVRYMKSLENKDISLVHSMIPLMTSQRTYQLTFIKRDQRRLKYVLQQQD
ncbi:glycine dehydrogenase (decarboxylating), mitochondrial-like [Copidosoma floridanum]|uniref:glycine dehydrogenase (decarboxylating), mitochondrial-like n=1 Tax=Copidosoma floridanum TaxID=29053 RepID=UPI000C6FB4A4|nr:glycine dehydrogenase (decarboxylating), mitochondrial-like [Copidosoma floridanum]